MRRQHERTLKALFSHPLHHNLRMAEVEGMARDLGLKVECLSDHRLNLQRPDGERIVLHAATGVQGPLLDHEGVLRLRRFLQQGGISPEHPEAEQKRVRGDQAKRLVVHLDHRGARLWWLEGEELTISTVDPHGLWSSHQRLSHRHDRDVAGQRAPLEFEYLNAMGAAIHQADRVLLVGHGHGESDLRHVLMEHLRQQHPEAIKKVETLNVDDTACTDAELLAIARAHFGNQPHRHQLHIPGQAVAEDKPESS